MLEIRKSSDRGKTVINWLDSRHTFSFGEYYDPNELGFSDLLVINDDRIQPGMGFGLHPHKDMEIFTYVLVGTLEHKDSLGTGSVIYPGDVQIMSAGTGIRHSEVNHSKSDLVHLLQIWITPEVKGVEPRYQQKHFQESEKRGRLRLIIFSNGVDGSLTVYQNVRVYAGLFNDQEHADLDLHENRFAYVHLARGECEINGIKLEEGDAVRIRRERSLHFNNGKNAEVLVFDLRPHE